MLCGLWGADHPQGAGETGDIRLGFDSRGRLEFHGSKIGSDGGPLLFRELNETPELNDIAGGPLGDTRTVHIPWSGFCASRASDDRPDGRRAWR